LARNGIGEPRRRSNRGSFRALVIGCALLLAVTTAIDTLLWGWLGLIATGAGGLGLLALLILIARRRRSVAG
jgi:hypothetical protein